MIPGSDADAGIRTGLTDVKIKACLMAGFEKLIDNPFGDLMALLMVIISASLVVLYMR